MSLPLVRRSRFGLRRFSLLQGCLVLLAPLLAVALRHFVPGASTLLETLELRLVDARFHWRGAQGGTLLRAAQQNVLIVAMDADASGRLGNPIPRRSQALLVRRLKAAGARAIIFDVLFADPNPDDEIFARACQEAGNVFLPFDDNAASPTQPQVLRQVQARFAYPLPTVSSHRAPHIGPPTPPLLRAARGGGHVALKSDLDNEYRSAILFLDAGAVYPHVALDAVCKTVWKVPSSQLQLRDGLLHVPYHPSLGPLQPLVTRQQDSSTQTSVAPAGWSIPLNFLGDHQTMSSLTVPFLDVLDDKVAARRIRGRVVLVGEVRAGSTDIRRAPFDTVEQTLGVEINATLVANLLAVDPRGGFLRRAAPLTSILTMLLLGNIMGLLTLRLRPAVALFWFATFCAVYLGVARQVFDESNLLLDATGPLFALVLSFFMLGSYQLVSTEREVTRNRHALQEAQELLGQSVNYRIAEKLLHDPAARTDLQIGVRREITVLFSDVRGFTQWSEQRSPEEVKARLDEYFPVMCEIAEESCEGYIDKFVGDALMVIWNGLDDQEDHPLRAVRAAWLMQHALEGLNEGWHRQKQEPFRVGIGIASGPAIFGSFGARHKKMVTALGDTVNLASRLESLTKDVGCNIIISHATWLAVREQWECVPLSDAAIRGKMDAQVLYAVTGPKMARGDAPASTGR